MNMIKIGINQNEVWPVYTAEKFHNGYPLKKVLDIDEATWEKIQKVNRQYEKMQAYLKNKFNEV